MAQTIRQYQVSPFTVPQNGQPGDADQVRGNDNTIATSFNNHDGDAGIHFQESTLALRPAAGTANRKWFTTDGKRIYRDNGGSWDEAAYLPLVGGTLSGSVTLSGLVSSTASIDTLTAASNTLNLGSNGANPLNLNTNGTVKWQIQSGGALVPGINATYDIGVIGTAVRNLLLSGSISIGANQILTTRDTGWTPMTGTPDKSSTFNVSTVTLAQLAARVDSLQTALTGHGIIGT